MIGKLTNSMVTRNSVERLQIYILYQLNGLIIAHFCAGKTKRERLIISELFATMNFLHKNILLVVYKNYYFVSSSLCTLVQYLHRIITLNIVFRTQSYVWGLLTVFFFFSTAASLWQVFAANDRRRQPVPGGDRPRLQAGLAGHEALDDQRRQNPQQLSGGGVIVIFKQLMNHIRNAILDQLMLYI